MSLPHGQLPRGSAIRQNQRTCADKIDFTLKGGFTLNCADFAKLQAP
jgi:hypothetical protein